MSNRIEKAKEKLDAAREAVKAVCEPVMEPRAQEDYIRYFCGDPAVKEDLAENEARRLTLYKTVASYVRGYANLANELHLADYSEDEAVAIKGEVEHFHKLCEEIKLASADYVDMKLFEPAMRYLLDKYIRAEDSEIVADFEELGLIDLIINKGAAGVENLQSSMNMSEQSMAESIENNIRKIIIDEQAVNPKYYDKMSELLDALIEERREQAIDYKTYLEKVKELSANVVNAGGTNQADYPTTVNTTGKKAIFDNFGQDEVLAAKIDVAVRHTKKDAWIGNLAKEREVAAAIYKEVKDEILAMEILELVKNQHEYK